MINLLSKEILSEYRAGRINLILVRYIMLLIGIAAVLLMALFLVFTHLNDQAYKADLIKNKNLSLVNQNVRSRDKVEALNNQLIEVKEILDNRISYYKIIQNIASSIPENAKLKQLDLNQNSIDKPIELTFYIKDEKSALDLIKSLEDHPKIINVKRKDISINTDNDIENNLVVTLTLLKENM